MGGGLAGPELAGAVAAAGGLGTLGLSPPADLRKAVRQVRDAAPDRSVAGARFLLTDEARAHPEYQRRILAADKTFRTTLFGLGWNSPLPMFSPIAPNHRDARLGGRARRAVRG